MAISKFTEDVNIISVLDDLPNDNDGLSAAELKAKFDLAAVLIKEYLNEILVPELEDAIAQAARGISQGGISGNIINNGTINSDKLIQIPGFETIITDVIRDAAITRAKLALKSVGTAQMDDASVTNSILASQSVSEVKLDSTLREKINRIISEAMLDDNLKEKINSHQKQHKSKQVTLSAGATSWSISVPEVSADSDVLATNAPESYDLWVINGIRISGKSAGTLTFAARSAPASAVKVNILILD